MLEIMKCRENCDCRFSECMHSCSSCPVRCCRRERAPFVDVDSLKVQAPAPAVPIPFDCENGQQIPRITSPHPSRSSAGGVRLISIRTAAKPSGHILKTGAAVPHFAGLTGLDFFVPDTLLEAMWARGHFNRVLPAELDVAFAIAPDFSVYWGDPRQEQDFAIARSLNVCDAWTRAGIPMIPIATWARDEHRIQIADFVQAGNYKTVALNFQMLHRTHRGKVVSEAREFMREAHVDNILICGGTSEQSRKYFKDELGDWSVTFAHALWFFDADRELSIAAAGAQGGS